MNELFIDFLQQLLMNEMPKMTKSFFQNSRKTRFSCYLRCLHCFSSISLALLITQKPYTKLINICSLFTLQAGLLFPRLLLVMTHWWLKSSFFKLSNFNIWRRNNTNWWPRSWPAQFPTFKASWQRRRRRQQGITEHEVSRAAGRGTTPLMLLLLRLFWQLRQRTPAHQALQYHKTSSSSWN